MKLSNSYFEIHIETSTFAHLYVMRNPLTFYGSNIRCQEPETNTRPSAWRGDALLLTYRGHGCPTLLAHGVNLSMCSARTNFPFNINSGSLREFRKITHFSVIISYWRIIRLHKTFSRMSYKMVLHPYWICTLKIQIAQLFQSNMILAISTDGSESSVKLCPNIRNRTSDNDHIQYRHSFFKSQRNLDRSDVLNPPTLTKQNPLPLQLGL